MTTSEAWTAGIKIEVRSAYVPEQSDPKSQHFFFSYQVTLTNESPETVQLISRHWIIRDGEGHVEEVKGPGVIGQQPILETGQSFSYTSFCPIKTPMGSMRGSYQMQREDGEIFDAEIGEFKLRPEYTLH